MQSTVVNDALIVGISDYSHSPLPGVAQDAKLIADLLASPAGKFGDSLTRILNKRATKKRIEQDLKRVLEDAGPDDGVFVFLAGHGTVVDGKGYFIPIDIDGKDIAGTAISVDFLRESFLATKSRRAIMVLDFCRSGSVLPREQEDVISRELKIQSGYGKVILTSAREMESAWEGPNGGWFTNAFLEGLKGGATLSNGDITIHSLYDFICDELAKKCAQNLKVQNPTISGQAEGKFVLVHQEVVVHESGQRSTTTFEEQATENLAFLENALFRVKGCQQFDNESLNVSLEVAKGENSTLLKRLSKGDRISFAYQETGGLFSVVEVTCDLLSGVQGWKLQLSPIPKRQTLEATFNGVSPDEIAELRARFILLGEEVPDSGRFFSIRHFVQANIEIYCPLLKHKNDLKSSTGLCRARLEAVVQLIGEGIVEQISVLDFERRENGEIRVNFIGERANIYSNRPPSQINFEGTWSP